MRRLSPLAVLLVLAALGVLAAPAAAAPDRSLRIVNGDATAPGDYPWTVALVAPNQEDAFCTGSLVRADVVLTAAHCTAGSRPDEIEVIVGATTLSDSEPANRRDVTAISLHPDEDWEAFRRDLSLLTLSSSALTAGAEVIAVGTEAGLEATNLLDISGWGLTSEIAPAGEDTMRHGTVGRLTDPDCGDLLAEVAGPGTFSPGDQVCAIGDRDGDQTTTGDVVDSCQGDSGGPLADPPDVADPDASTAVGWTLYGATSYGFGCATTIDLDGTPTPLPGVYARPSGPQLDDYVLAGTNGTTADDPPPQPSYESGAPALSVDPSPEDGSIVCSAGSLAFSNGGDDDLRFLIRRLGASGLETVSTTGVYDFDLGDAGDDFFCEVRAYAPGAGGYGLARSGFVTVDEAPGPGVVTVPGPTVTVPGPTVTVPGPPPPPTVVAVPVPQPRVADDVAPRTTRVTRSCRRRVCTVTVRTTDASPSAGVKGVLALLKTTRVRPCVKRGRRTTCVSTRTRSLRATPIAGRTGEFTVRTPRLSLGSHSLLLSAVDAAGNFQPTPQQLAVTVR